MCYIFTNNFASKQHYDKAGPSSFPVRGIECEINNNESEDDYSEGQDEGTDDDIDVRTYQTQGLLFNIRRILDPSCVL